MNLENKSKFEEFVFELKMYIKYRNFMVRTFRNIKNGVRNLIIWGPTIWRDRDWDYGFLLDMMSKKMEHMGKYHNEKGTLESSDKSAKDLMRASELALKIRLQDYEEEAFGDKLYLRDKNKMVITPFEDKEGGTITFEGLSKEEREEYRKLVLRQSELIERDKNELFDLMSKEIFSWWD